MQERVLKSILLRPGMESQSKDLLNDLIEDSISDVRELINYNEDEQIPISLDTVVKELVSMKINRLGSEGISSESNSGISQTYNLEISPESKKKIRKIRRLRRC